MRAIAGAIIVLAVMVVWSAALIANAVRPAVDDTGRYTFVLLAAAFTLILSDVFRGEKKP